MFDEMGRDVISSVLRVNDLRASGVHSYIPRGHCGMLSIEIGYNTSEYQHHKTYDPRCMCYHSFFCAALSDPEQVPVIYLVEPTGQNLQRITDDLSRGLYS